MLSELTEGAFSAYDTISDEYFYVNNVVSRNEPWGIYTITPETDEIRSLFVFAAASEYKAIQTLSTSTANTAEKVPVTANSHRQKEQHVFHTEFAYSTVDERSYLQAVIRSLKQLQDKTAFEVILPTGRTVTVTFNSIDDTWPFDYGKVIVIIQAEEYNPFPIFSSEKSVNKKYNGFFGDQGGIKSEPESATATPEIQQ